jgi:KDO2-lipid IV(A) lauroyltransferase
MMVRVAIFLVWLLHFLPLVLLAPLGQGLGMLFYALGRERRRVARTNLRLCFPELSPQERERLLRRHFRAFGRSVFERGYLWWSSAERIKRMVRIEGLDYWRALEGRPVIGLAPHFVGLDMAASRLSIDISGASMYSRQKDPVFDRILLRGRMRFKEQKLLSRQAGALRVVRVIREGYPFYYLPDMDFGRRNSIFVPFFGVAAATVPALAQIARLSGAVVLPVVTRQLPGGQGYVIRFYPPWDNFPTDDIDADTRRMNAFIEDRVREMPEQYFWLHKRFKTRPPGEPSVYE